MVIIAASDASPGYENYVPAGCHRLKANDISQTPFHLISYHRISYPFTHQKPEPAPVQTIRYNLHHQQPVGPYSTLLVYQGKSLAIGKTSFSLHRDSATCLHRQLVAALKPATLQYGPTPRGARTSTESVNSLPSAFLRLICALRHDNLPCAGL